MSADPSVRLPALAPLVAGQVRFHLGLLMRTPRAMSTGLVVPLLLLLLSNSRHGQLTSAQLAGPAVLGLTMTAWTTHGIALVAAREAGVLKRWRATPLPAWCYFTGRIGATVLVAVLAGTVTVLTGVVLYAAQIDPARAATLVIALLAGATACAAAATAVTGLVPNVAAAFPILGLSYLPVVLISGVFGRVSTEPHWLTTVASYLPVQPVVEAATRALEHSSLAPRDLIVLLAWMICGVLAALVTFRWEPVRRGGS